MITILVVFSRKWFMIRCGVVLTTIIVINTVFLDWLHVQCQRVRRQIHDGHNRKTD